LKRRHWEEFLIPGFKWCKATLVPIGQFYGE
jgi:hypothetical protein